MTAAELTHIPDADPSPRTAAPVSTSSPRLSLRMLLGALVTVSVATAILIWGWATWNDHLDALQKARSDSQFLVHVVEQQARSSILGALSLINAVAGHLDASGTQAPPDRSAILAEMHDAAAALPGLGGIEIADSGGLVLFSTDTKAQAASRIDGETLAAHRGGTTLEISGATIQPDGSGYFTISRAQRREGVITSITLVKIDLAAFVTFNLGLNIDPTSRVGVLRTDDAQFVELFPLRQVSSHQSFRNLAVFQHHLSARNEGTFDVENSIDGVDRIVSYRILDGFPLVAVSGISRPQVLSDYWNKEFRSAAYLVSALAAIVLLAILMLLNLTREQRMRERSVVLAQDLNLAIEIADLGTFDYDLRAGTMGCGGAFRAVFGFDDMSAPTLELLMDRIIPEDRAAEIAAFNALTDLTPTTFNDGAFRREFRILRGGQVCWILLQGRALFASTDAVRVVRIVGAVRDVTNRRALIEKKDSILREVNHRVMNSLQVLCSILSLQARSIGDPDERKRFDEAAMRVASLATVHGRLFRTQNLEKIEVGTYLAGLCHDLANSLLDGSHVRVSGRSNGAVLASTDEIMPLGLIVAELVNGAARHIASSGGRGDIALDFDSRVDHARLTITATTALAETPEPQGHHREGTLPTGWCDPFGATLAQLMIEQIGGTLPPDECSGGRVVIEFPWLAAA